MSTASIMGTNEIKDLIFAERISEPDEPAYGVYLGNTEIYRIPFMLDHKLLVNPHMSVIGTSGSGKSYFIKNTIARYSMQFGSAAIIIDWNGEYDDIVRFMGGKVIRLGEDNINMGKILFGSCQTDEEVLQLLCDLASATNAERKELVPLIYNSDFGMRVLKSADAIMELSGQLIERGPHGKSLADKLAYTVALKLFASAAGPKISIREGVSSLNLQRLPNDQIRKRVSRAVLNMLANAMHSLKPDGNANSAIVIDEAWRMLDSTYNLGAFFREARKYGLRIIAATQLLSDFGSDIISNSATIVVFKTSNPSDIEVLLNMEIITESDAEKIRELAVGRCMIYMSEKDGDRLPKKFFIRKIEGLNIKEFVVRVSQMKKYIEQSKMMDTFEGIGVSKQKLPRVFAVLDQITDEIEIETLVSKLLSAGLERDEIVVSLRILGFEDLAIVNAYNIAIEDRGLYAIENKE